LGKRWREGAEGSARERDVDIGKKLLDSAPRNKTPFCREQEGKVQVREIARATYTIIRFCYSRGPWPWTNANKHRREISYQFVLTVLSETHLSKNFHC